jgi:hypothetical protein
VVPATNDVIPGRRKIFVKLLSKRKSHMRAAIDIAEDLLAVSDYEAVKILLSYLENIA